MSESAEPRDVVEAGPADPHWNLFICYRQVDGREAATWLHSTLSGRELPFIPEGFARPPRLQVYFDQAAPAVDDWTRIHKPALSRARALLFVCSPGAYARLGDDDWVHEELDWWIANRAAAPILIDPTGDGSRWIPASVSQRWPNAQRLLLQPALWERLPADERAAIETNLRDRIIGGIRESERSTTYQDLEREKQRAREFEQQAQALRTQGARLRIYFGSAVVALSLAAAAAFVAVRQQRATESQAMQTRASLALATAASVRDPLAAAMLLITADDILRAGSLPVPPGAGGMAHRIARLPRPKALMRHTDRVTSASFSPDGRRIVTSSFDRTARIWSADGIGTPITLSGHEGLIFSAEFNPAGDRVVTASADGTARIWNASDGRALGVFRGHQRDVLSATFSADGSRIVTASDDRTARIWTVDESKPPIVLSDHEGTVRTAVFDRAGDRVVTASDDGTARVWKTDGSRTPSVVLDPPVASSSRGSEGVFVNIIVRRSPLITAAFSPDGKRVIAAGGGAFVWNADGSGSPVKLAGSKDDSFAEWSAFSPDGRFIATRASDGVTSIWKLGSDERPVLIGMPKQLVGAGATLGGPAEPRLWATDSKRILAISPDGTVTVSNVDGTDGLTLVHDAGVVGAQFSPDGSQIVTAAADGTVRVWEAAGSAEPIELRGHNEWVNMASFSPDGRRLATASNDSTARVWKVDDPRTPVVLEGHGAPPRHVAFTRDGKRILTASHDGTLRIWDVDSARAPATLGELNDHIGSVVWSPDMRRAVVVTEKAQADNAVVLWDLETGASKRLRRFSKELWPPIFSSDASRILAVMPDGSVRTWAVDGDGEPATVSPHRPGAVSAQISPDGSAILLLMNDGTVKLRQIDTEAEISLAGYVGSVQSVGSEPELGLSFGPDGRRIVISERPGHVRIWPSPESSQPVTIPAGQGRGLLFSPDGTLVAVTNIIGRPSRIWNADGRGDPLELDDGRIGVVDAAFSPDGSRLVTVADKSVRLWRVGWRGLIDFLKATTNACLTSEQRRQWLAETPDVANAASAACEARLRSQHRA